MKSQILSVLYFKNNFLANFQLEFALLGFFYRRDLVAHFKLLLAILFHLNLLDPGNPDLTLSPFFEMTRT